MSKDTLAKDQIAKEVLKVPAETWLDDQYILYTMYVIQSRALVSDDGLKPVNRRILYTLFKDGLGPNATYMKAARAAGNTMAFHPHGNAPIEDAMARMAQKFSMRVPLIDPYGSVGAVTGDTPSAARYWECRLTKPAMELLKELSEGAIEMGQNYDGTEDEPMQLPVRWPNNIINGSEGIAVAFACKIHPHNPSEVIEAARKMLKNPEMTTKQLMKVMPGPDFPTGGELMGVDGVKEYYETGMGSFTVRGRYTIEELPRGKAKIIFYELPYQVSAQKIQEKIISSQKNSNGFKGIAKIKNLTDKKNGLRLMIETKSGTNYRQILNEIFKKTQAEDNFSTNMTVLVDNSPQLVNMFDLIRGFLDLRRVCNIEKANTRMGKIDNRIKQLKALLTALVDIDKAVSIIRQADSSDSARKNLCKEFKFDNEDAEYILSMQLRRLTKADAIAIQKEHDDLLDERKELNELLTDEEKMTAHIDKELKDTKKVIASERKTIINGMTAEEIKDNERAEAQALRDADKNLPCVVTRFADGTILKTDDPFEYSSNDKTLKNGPIIEAIKMKTKDNLIVVTSDGIGHKVSLSYITGTKPATPEKLGLTLDKGVKLIGIAKEEAMKSDVGLAMGTRFGEVKISKCDFPNKDEFPVFTLQPDDEIIGARWLGKSITNSYFIFGAKDSNALVFPATSIRASGSKSGGVRGMKLKDDNEAIYFDLIENIKDNKAGILTKTNESIKFTPISQIPTKNKAGMGVATHLFRKGESTLVDFGFSNDPVATLEGTNDKVNLPAPSKRAASGVKANIPVVFGSLNVDPV